MQVEILNTAGEKTGRSIELPEEIFGIEPNDHCIYLAVKQYLAAQRQGTHKTKTRAEVHGSSKKLHKQKGTGGSRKGNIRNPLYKGGGAVNGPLPHLYGFKLNRKVKDLAKMSALAHKAREQKIVVVEDIVMEAPKTKEFHNILEALRGDSYKSLFVIAEDDRNIYLSSRNIQDCKTTVLSDLNTYDITNAQVVIFTESAASMFSEEAEDDFEQPQRSSVPADRMAAVAEAPAHEKETAAHKHEEAMPEVEVEAAHEEAVEPAHEEAAQAEAEAPANEADDATHAIESEPEQTTPTEAEGASENANPENE
jgi:large subunit ribosomal protein L4